MTTFKACHCGHGVLIPNGERFECSWTLEKYKAVHGHVPDSFKPAWDAYQVQKLNDGFCHFEHGSRHGETCAVCGRPFPF